MKIALVHDYLTTFGGAEQVLASLHEIFPDAPIYTLFSSVVPNNQVHYDTSQYHSEPKQSSGGDCSTDLLSQKFGRAKIVESWFAKIPFHQKLISPLRFLIPFMWSSFDFSEYDLIISSASWAITKGFISGSSVEGVNLLHPGGVSTKPVEICYCHTPPRYLYGYETSRNWKEHWWLRFYALIVNHFMRLYDYQQAQKVDYFIANSKIVKERIQKFYRRESTVIHPPVDILKIPNPKSEIPNKFQIPNPKSQNGGGEAAAPNNFFLAGGRLERAKNFDLIIRACYLANVSLKIYGMGSQESSLHSLFQSLKQKKCQTRTRYSRLLNDTSQTQISQAEAKSGFKVEFLGQIKEEEKWELLRNCRAFIVAAADEDFGITPVEAMAAGRPVIAFRGGGYQETVIEGKTGLFFEELTPESLAKAIYKFKIKSEKLKIEDCLKQARNFSQEKFHKNMVKFIHAFFANSSKLSQSSKTGT